MWTASLRIAGIAVISLGCTAWAHADIKIDPPAPKPKAAQQAVPFKVLTDPKADHSRLLVPTKLLAGAGREEKKGAAIPYLHTIIAGLALSFSIAGLVLIGRRRRVFGPRLQALAAVMVCLTLTGVVWADIAGPGPRTPRPRRPIPEVKDLQALPGLPAKVALEVTADGDAITLILGGPDLPGATGATPENSKSAPPHE